MFPEMNGMTNNKNSMKHSFSQNSIIANFWFKNKIILERAGFSAVYFKKRWATYNFCSGDSGCSVSKTFRRCFPAPWLEWIRSEQELKRNSFISIYLPIKQDRISTPEFQVFFLWNKQPCLIFTWGKVHNWLPLHFWLNRSSGHLAKRAFPSFDGQSTADESYLVISNERKW